MSGLAKGIGKVFKGAFNVIKKVAIPALAVGAAIMTGGGGIPALGGLLGGGGAVTTAATGGGLLSGLLSSEVVGSVVSGAVSGWAAKAEAEDAEQADIDTESRRTGRYEGFADALTWEPSVASAQLAPQPMHPRVKPRETAVQAQANVQRAPRIQYDRDAGRITYS